MSLDESPEINLYVDELDETYLALFTFIINNNTINNTNFGRPVVVKILYTSNLSGGIDGNCQIIQDLCIKILFYFVVVLDDF